MSLKAFANRKYDFLAFQPVALRTDGLKDMALYDPENRSKIVIGPQKLAQRWTLEFLTERGSMPYRLGRGTNFMTQIRFGRIRTETELRAAFNSAELAIARNLRAEETAETPDEERYDRAILANVIAQPGYVDLRVIIVSRAGEARKVTLPIETLP
jgi:hypothetical protein